MPMHPSPMAETSMPLLPRIRLFIRACYVIWRRQSCPRCSTRRAQESCAVESAAMAEPLRWARFQIGDTPMKRWSLALPLTLLFSLACASTQPAPAKVATDPTLDPTIIGAVDEAVAQGLDEGAEAARVGRRIGRVAGVVAAVVGGPSH